VQVPVDKYLAEDYRQVLRTVDAPQNINTEVPITPAVIVNQGLPRPNSKQILRYTTVVNGAGNNSDQIATPNSTTNIYFLGCLINSGAVNFCVWDGTSGDRTSLTDGQTTNFYYGSYGGTTNVIDFVPFPVKATSGIRVTTTGVSSVIVYYIEEIV